MIGMKLVIFGLCVIAGITIGRAVARALRL